MDRNQKVTGEFGEGSSSEEKADVLLGVGLQWMMVTLSVSLASSTFDRY